MEDVKFVKKWFIVNTYSGFENSVKVDLERRRESMNMQDYVLRVLVPEETVEVVDKKGNKKLKVNKLFPGYVFVEINIEKGKEMDDHAWFMIRNTPKVTGFLGSSGGGTKPIPVPNDEMDRILSRLGLIVKAKSDIALNDDVDIVNGSFASFSGKVTAIDENKRMVTVQTELMPITVSLDDVKKSAIQSSEEDN